MAYRKGGSQFTDVSRYLSQNQPGAQRLASRMGNQVVGAGNQARGQIAGAQNAFNNQVAQNEVAPNQALIGQVAANPQNLFNQPAPQQQVFKGPARSNNKSSNIPNFANFLSSAGNPINRMTPAQAQPLTVADQSTFNQFQTMLNAKPYAGPTDLSQAAGYEDALKGIGEAQGIAQTVGTPEGRAGLLQDLYGNRRSSGGLSALDSALLGGQTGILQQAAAGNEGLGQDLEKAQRIAAARAQKAAANNQESAESSRKALADSYAQVQKEMAKPSSKAAQYNKKLQVNNPEYQRKLQALQALMGNNL